VPESQVAPTDDRGRADLPQPEPPMPEPHPLDVVPPAQIAQLVEAVGVRKASLPVLQTLMLGVLAGAFIAFGGMFYTLVVTGSELGYGPTRLLGGLAFSLGLILVIVGGAELFTGNNLIVMAWADRKINTVQLVRNWVLVFAGNAVGAFSCVVLVHGAGILAGADGAIAETARSIAGSKAALPWDEAFLRAILCNVLVCLAVWMSFAAHSVPGKAIGIVFPVTAFVALGFEHSIANLYLMPIGALQAGSTVTWQAILENLAVVTAGNIVGGVALVALVYWIVYLRRP